MPLRLALNAMGTRFECVLSGLPDADLRAAGEEALESIAEVERWLSRFRKDSAIARINAAAGLHPIQVNSEVFDLLMLCARLGDVTDGAFDICLGQRMQALGFWGASESLPPAVASAPGTPGPRLQLCESTGSVALSAVGDQIDLGAVGKGFALDCAAEVLRDAGVQSALIHGGTSTSIAIGSPGGTQGHLGWPLAISHPQHEDDPRGLAWIRVQLCDRALSVSAPHGRTIRSDNAAAEIPHIIDPRNQTPLPLGGLAVSMHESAAVADAWSTALLVLQEVPHAAPVHSLLLNRFGELLRHPQATMGDVFEVSEFG